MDFPRGIWIRTNNQWRRDDARADVSNWRNQMQPGEAQPTTWFTRRNVNERRTGERRRSVRLSATWNRRFDTGFRHQQRRRLAPALEGQGRHNFQLVRGQLIRRLGRDTTGIILSHL